MSQPTAKAKKQRAERGEEARRDLLAMDGRQEAAVFLSLSLAHSLAHYTHTHKRGWKKEVAFASISCRGEIRTYRARAKRYVL